ncbi:MAG: sigma factor-like helix-turn-helix DNA-binding protein [Phycisphaerales bacterium]|jgi:DNA-directed RNA polymerase specialized sigma subunit
MIGKDAALVRELASGLDRVERLVVSLRYTEDLSVAEIAAITRLAASDVQRHLDGAASRVKSALASRTTVATLRTA